MNMRGVEFLSKSLCKYLTRWQEAYLYFELRQSKLRFTDFSISHRGKREKFGKHKHDQKVQKHAPPFTVFILSLQSIFSITLSYLLSLLPIASYKNTTKAKRASDVYISSDT